MMALPDGKSWAVLRAALATTAVSVGLVACGGGGGSADSPAPATMTPMALVGQKAFADVSLSASGKQSCATCHDPATGHAPANDLPGQMGGALLSLQGGRQAPALRYLGTNTAFFFDGEGTPTGGFFWDGRANSLADQAGGPLLNPLEMANTDKAGVVAKLAASTYAAEFKKVFGADVFKDTDGAFQKLTLAIQKYEQEDTDFNAYTSKYDAFLRGTTTLSAIEMRGLALFNNPTKGNCIGCHPSGKGANGALPLFTDFTYDALGVPRNPELTQNADPAYYDLGLCARATNDLLGRTDLCGAFKVPSLRNVALRRTFFHNGKFKTLNDAVSFYVQRDTNPEKWYPANADGSINKFDDLPAAYKRNVNTTEVPYNRTLGDAPALNDAEVEDLIAFLKTLTDGYTP